MYELFDIMRQKYDLAFAQLLNRLRLNQITEEDKQKLQNRVVNPDTDDYPKDAVHLFAENFYVAKHNDNILSQLPGEKVVIPCHDSVVSANIPAKECQNLIDKLPDKYSKTGQLMKSLTVVVGMIVVHTANVDVEDGLTNGATGVVKHIDFRMEGTNRPSIIMPPTLKKLMGHIAFGACVDGCMRGWVTLFVPTVTFKPLKLES